MEKNKTSKNVYAFIDAQNLNLGTSKDILKGKKTIYKGWKLDFRKFRKHISNKYRVQKAFLFMGFIPEYQKMYDSLKRWGYELILKPTTKDSEGKPKGNIDAELVLHACRIEHDNYDEAVIVSGDGDFYCLHEYLEQSDKLKAIIIPNHHNESSLLKKFQKYKRFLQTEKGKLEYS